MKQKERIEKFEVILNKSAELTKEVETALDNLEKYEKDYDELVKYYYSKNWSKDKEDFENNLISNVKSAWVLTEDSIYDTMIDKNQLAIRMLEIATKILKK